MCINLQSYTTQIRWPHAISFHLSWTKFDWCIYLLATFVAIFYCYLYFDRGYWTRQTNSYTINRTRERTATAQLMLFFHLKATRISCMILMGVTTKWMCSLLGDNILVMEFSISAFNHRQLIHYISLWGGGIINHLSLLPWYLEVQRF